MTLDQSMFGNGNSAFQQIQYINAWAAETQNYLTQNGLWDTIKDLRIGSYGDTFSKKIQFLQSIVYDRHLQRGLQAKAECENAIRNTFPNGSNILNIIENSL